MKSIVLLVVMMISVCALNAQHIIKGKVTAASDGEALPGVNIVIERLNIGTITNFDGIYELYVNDSLKSTDELVFSFIGFQSQKLQYAGQSTIDCNLEAADVSLDEVVVTSYGIERKVKALGYSISKSAQRLSLFGKKQKRVSNNNDYDKNNSSESYSEINENKFKDVKENPLSTFSIDVDRASYSNVRRFIENGELPPKDAVRIEEMINYFEYDYPVPDKEHPLIIVSEVAECPWNNENKILQIGMQARKIDSKDLPPSNLVFLIDVSGSMSQYNKLPLLKKSFKLLVNNLREQDKVSIVVYAGAAGLVLPPTSGSEKDKIIKAFEKLEAGGSTAGGEGIRLAYKVARENFKQQSNNRVILATDGDFNVGFSSDREMKRLIEKERKSGVYLTCLGFGMGNYKDSKLETLADKGNGNYAYIDNEDEAKKTLVKEFGGTMHCVAKDVKLQVEFNPDFVKSYRLIGYENRLLNDEDFDDDTKDAGEVGAGHSVTALYEIVPVVKKNALLASKNTNALEETTEHQKEVAKVKLRYKRPEYSGSTKLEFSVVDKVTKIDEASENLRFATSIAMFGMLLRQSEYAKKMNFEDVMQLAKEALGKDKNAYRKEFLKLVKKAQSNRI